MPQNFDHRAIFDASPNAYMVLDRELRYVDANRTYLELTASQRSELIGRNIFDVFPNDPSDPNNLSAQLLRESFERVLQTGKRDVIAFLPYNIARTPNGKLEARLWSASHEPLFDARGQVAFILQNTTDVSELARIQTLGDQASTSQASNVLLRAQHTAENNRVLGNQLANLRSLVDQAPGFVCFLSGPDHVFEIANQAFTRMIGCRDVIGKSVRAAMPDMAGQGYFELLDEVLRSGKPFVGHGMRVELTSTDASEAQHDFEAASPKQYELIADFVYQPIFASDGKPLGILVWGNDVTEQSRQASRQRFLIRVGECLAGSGRDLEQSLRQLARAAVPDLADWAFVDLLDGASYRRLIAVPPDEARAALAERMLAAPPRIEHDSPFTRALVAPQATLIEDPTDAMRSAIAQAPNHLSLMNEVDIRSLLVVPLRLGPHLFGAITLGLAQGARRYHSSDVAIAKELACVASIALDNARLTRELAELRQREQDARERAEAAHETKDEFLAMLGHELRNPLAPILTAVQLMKLRAGGEAMREQVIIERQAKYLVRLVDDLLDVSRIARAKVQLRKTPTDLASAITKAVEIASPLLERQGHDLQLDIAREGLLVFGDEARLSLMVANLLTNAARFTPPHGRVQLRAQRERDQVVLRVADNGVGLSAELLARILELFAEGPRHSDPAEGGPGLGLSVVRNLVTMHGGSIDATSAGTNRGSEFTIRLPAYQPPSAAESADASSSPTAGTAITGRVLIVDDNADAVELLAQLLEAHGHVTARAFDGPGALREALLFQPQVAILDIGLPVMDGYELASQLKAAFGERAPRLIALTGYGQDYDRARSLDAGFFAHLVKPVDSEVLFETLALAEAAAGR